MGATLKELNERLIEITSKCEVLSLQMKQNRLPEYLKPGNLFLGQYKILEVEPLKHLLIDKIIAQRKLLNQYDSSKTPLEAVDLYNRNQLVFEDANDFNPMNNTSDGMSKETKSKRIALWKQPLNHTFLYGLNYAYRAKTQALFSGMTEHVYDFFIVDD